MHFISGHSEKAVGGLSVCVSDRHGCHLFHLNSGFESSQSEVGALHTWCMLLENTPWHS